MKPSFLVLACFGLLITGVNAENRHGESSRYQSYQGLVMCGYQGWFRAQGDGSDKGWVHYGVDGKMNPQSVHVDLWPDVSEYEKTYPTQFTNQDGTIARVFSSWDESTVDLHFRWMQEYGIDGVFVQRFFNDLRSEKQRRESRVVLEHALQASKKHGRAIAVMYDLSGLKNGEDCSAIIQDWKELVDQLKITSQGANQTYLYNHGKPLVAIWGLGFPDRPYNIHDMDIERTIAFLKNDPQYGGCAVLLGVPTYFRDLNGDCVRDPYLHSIMESADIIMPWMVGRFTSLRQDEAGRYASHIKADIAWCADHHVEYVPCVYPGFSWYNLSRFESKTATHPLNQIPRLGGEFYWDQISAAVQSGARMFYVAMFDELDEGTAILKISPTPPPEGQFVTTDGFPSDHYLWLTGEAGKMLRKEIPFTNNLPSQNRREANAP